MMKNSTWERCLVMLSVPLTALGSLAACGDDDCTKTATCASPTVGAGGASTSSGQGASSAGGTASSTGGGGSDLLANGEACDDGDACGSSQCVDGVCCDTVCAGACESCAIEGAAGTCSPHAALTDPEDECELAACDGSGSCALGQALWELYFGDGSDQIVNDAHVDDAGNVYVTGTFTGAWSLGNTTLTSAGGEDAFIAKIAASGTVIWAKSLGGTEPQRGSSVTAGDTRAYFAGTYRGTPSIDGLTLDEGSGLSWYLIALDDATGAPDWEYGFASSASSAGYAVRDIAASGTNVVVASTGNVTLLPTPILVRKLNSFGSVVESNSNVGKAISSIRLLSSGAVVATNSNEIFRLASNLTTEEWNTSVGDLVHTTTLADGSIVAVGSFSGTFSQGSTLLTSAGKNDMLVAKFSSGGVFETAVAFGGAEDDQLVRVAHDGTSIAVGGWSEGDLTINGTPYPSGGGRDAVVLKLSVTDLSPQWARRAGGPNTQEVTGLGMDSLGRVDVAGTFFETLDFGPEETSTGNADGFVVQLSP